MTEQLSIETISQDLRRELARHCSLVPGDRPSSGAEVPSISLPRLDGGPPFDPERSRYHLNEFLNFHDRDFVLHAYRGILKRAPDGDGLNHFLENLRAGRLAKVEIIGRLRFSKEGKEKRVKIQGLLPVLFVALLGKVPIVGYFSRWLVAWLRLPVMVGNLTRFEAHAAAMDARLVEHVTHLTAQLEVILGRQEILLAKLESDKVGGEKVDRLGADLEKLSAHLGQVNQKVSALQGERVNEGRENRQQFEILFAKQQQLVDLLERKAEAQDFLAGITRLTERQDADHEELLAVRAAQAEESVVNRRQVEDLISQQQRLNELLGRKAEEQDLLAAIARLTARQEANQTQLAMVTAELEVVRKDLPAGAMAIALPTDIEALYVAFEERFRGSREEIRKRQLVYLPLFEKLRATIPDGELLDLGCGRGEWLELLTEHGHPARGVDLNRLMVGQCQSLGLAVTQAEALASLRAEAPNSVAAITAFHLLEHLSFSHLLALFAEVRRVLKPGGLALFETPNPENILVGAFFFHTDPTHRQPLAPESLKFYMDYLGFAHVDLIRLHPYPGQEENKAASGFQRQWIETAMDYAVYGYKP